MPPSRQRKSCLKKVQAVPKPTEADLKAKAEAAAEREARRVEREQAKRAEAERAAAEAARLKARG